MPRPAAPSRPVATTLRRRPPQSGRRLTGWLIPALASLALAAPAPVGAQVSRYYLTFFNENLNGFCSGEGGFYEIRVYQGGALVNCWVVPTEYENPIAVAGTVRTAGKALGTMGREWTLVGAPIPGVTFGALPQNASDNAVLDGTTDGTSNYAVANGNGNVYRYNADWTGATLFLQVGRDNQHGIAFDDNGTPDPDDDSLWILCHTCPNTVEQRSLLNGLIMHSFTLPPAFLRTALALDPVDRTLWMATITLNPTVKRLEQYARNTPQVNGMPLSSIDLNSLSTPFGGEFQDRSYLTVTKTGSGTGTVTSVPSGINCGVACTEATASYPTGTVFKSPTELKQSTVALIATPAPGSLFIGWGGDADCGDGNVTMSANRSCVAAFSPTPKFLLTVLRAGTGTGTVSSNPASIDNCGLAQCTAVFDEGTAVTLTPLPAAGSLFAGWNGEGCSGTGVCVVPMIANRSVTATFVAAHVLTVTLVGDGTAASQPAGIVCGGDCAELYVESTVVQLLANPGLGSLFVGWSGDPDCADGVVTMSAARGCIATFGPPLTVTKSGEGSGTVTTSPPGIVCGSDCTRGYAPGAVVTLTAVADAGSVFAGFGGDFDCGDGVVTMTAARSCTAVFSPVGTTQFVLTVSRTGTGTVVSVPPGIACGSDCTGSYLAGVPVALVATPATGSTFVGWVGGDPDCADGVVTLAADTACTAEFATLRVDPVGPGLVVGGESLHPSITDDGRLIAFESTAATLTPECGTPERQIYVRDRVTGGVRCVSRGSGGAPGNGPSRLPSISGDGRWVAFQSSATNLVAGCTMAGEQVFVRDLETGVTECASVGVNGAPAVAASGAPALSRDGRFVAFQSDATNLDPRCASGVPQVFVRDLAAHTTACVSLTGAGPGNLTSGEPAITRDGSLVVFQSNATNFTGSGCLTGRQIFAWARAGGTITCLSRGPDGAPGNAASGAPAVNDDGTRVGFESDATNLVPACVTGVRQIFVHDRDTGATRCVSRAEDGQAGNGASSDAALSGDGLVVAYATAATNLVGVGSASLSAPSGVTTQTELRSQILRQSSSVANAVSELLSQAGGTAGAGQSRRPALDRTGGVTAFETNAPNLPTGTAPGMTGVVVVASDIPPPQAVGRPRITSPVDFSQFALPAQIPFAWTEVPGAVRYGFEYTAPNRRFANPNGAALDPVNEGNVLVFDALRFTPSVGGEIPAGTYQVRVIGVSAGGAAVGTFSDAVTLILGEVPSAAISVDARVTLTRPTGGTPLARGTTVTFEWTALVGVSQYLLEVTRPNGQFAVPNAPAVDPGAAGRVAVTGTSFSPLVPPDLTRGIYQVRVIGLSATGLVGRFSDAVTVRVE